MQTTFALGAIDWTIILIYFIFVLGIGWALKKYMKDSTAFLEAGSADANPMGVGWFGVLMGLGFVMSFGYWCTNFLVVQRAMAAGFMSAFN